MQIFRHSQIAMTMEIYSEVPTAKTRTLSSGSGGSSMARVAVLSCCTETERAGSVLKPALDLGKCGAEGI
jgi:hypothetical protein